MARSKVSKTTGETMMALRRVIGEGTSEPWHQVVRFKPLGEEVRARFSLSVKLDSGFEWMGEYAPDLSDEEMQAILAEVVAMRQSAPRDVIPPAMLAGKTQRLTLANGNIVDVKVQEYQERETPQEEDARRRDEIESADKVTVYADRAEDVIWCGILWSLLEGENLVPKPIADLYSEHIRESRKARARMGQVLPFEQAAAFLDTQRSYGR